MSYLCDAIKTGNDMKTSMIISNDSRMVTRMSVIARRTGSEFIAGAKAVLVNLTKKQNEIEQIEYNLATAMNAEVSEICSKQLVKVESERDEILRELEERDNSILNLSPRMSSCLCLT